VGGGELGVLPSEVSSGVAFSLSLQRPFTEAASRFAKALAQLSCEFAMLSVGCLQLSHLAPQIGESCVRRRTRGGGLCCIEGRLQGVDHDSAVIEAAPHIISTAARVFPFLKRRKVIGGGGHAGRASDLTSSVSDLRFSERELALKVSRASGGGRQVGGSGGETSGQRVDGGLERDALTLLSVKLFEESERVTGAKRELKRLDAKHEVVPTGTGGS
jgi:hypothetical protein